MRMLPMLLCLVAIVFVPIAACGGPQYGIGQGQPTYPERSAVANARLPMAITALFVARDPSKPTSTNATYGYVQLNNLGPTAIDLNQVSLSLVSVNGSVTLDPNVFPSLQEPLQPNIPRAVVDTSLATFAQNLPYPAGQVVLVDNAFVVQAYLGWGTAPLQAPYPEYTSLAISSHAISDATGNFLDLTTLNAPVAPATSIYLAPPGTVAP